MTLPSTLPAALHELADLLDIRGASHDASALRRTASADAGTVKLDSTFGASLLAEIQAGDASRALRRARASVPSLIRDTLDRGVLTTGDACRLVRGAAVVTVADLGPALDDGRVAKQLGAEKSGQLAAYLDSLGDSFIPLGRAADIADSLIADIASAAPMLEEIQAAGDVRRSDPFVSSVIIVARCDNHAAAAKAIASTQHETDVLFRSAKRIAYKYRQTEVDLRIAAPEEYGTVLFSATGSRAHYRSMFARRGRIALGAREETVYADAGVPWIPPELREGRGEIEAAARGVLPGLVERRHIRGDLHMHSTYSDGRDSVEAMVDASRGLGYEYIAITDHSHTAGASRTLLAGDIPKQREEIARLRERYPDITILQGVEVDILPNGTLDFPDSILEGFDIVLASLHEQVGQDGPRLTKRCLAAIRHPLVNVITHPENRPPGRRTGYPVDFEQIYAAAAETGTALEIDGAPGHLDLDGEHARAAAQAGVTLVIDSDCHRATSLERQMRFGVGLARRGWIRPEQVLNTRPIEQILTFVRAKRARG